TEATITVATPFDPPPGDGTEGNADAPKAIDGDPTTSWSTDQYNQFPDGPKKGVGLALSLNGDFDVSKVIVDTTASGWGAQIYVSDKDAGLLTTLDDWGSAWAQGNDLEASNTFSAHAVKGRSVLVWLTQLPAGQNGRHYVEVSEVRVA